MKTVGVYEARTQLSELLREVEAGETVSITRNGREIAHVIPAPKSTADIQKLIDEWFEYRDGAGVSLGGMTYRELIEEGRRF